MEARAGAGARVVRGPADEAHDVGEDLGGEVVDAEYAREARAVVDARDEERLLDARVDGGAAGGLLGLEDVDALDTAARRKEILVSGVGRHYFWDPVLGDLQVDAVCEVGVVLCGQGAGAWGVWWTSDIDGRDGVVLAG